MSAALRWIHVLSGCVVLLAMWVPIFTRKGSRAHVAGGWAFAGSMAVLCITSVVLCVMQLVAGHSGTSVTGRGTAQDDAFAVLLAFISVYCVNQIVAAVRAARVRSIPSATVDRSNTAALGASALGTIGYGAATGTVVLLVVGTLGLLATRSQWSAPGGSA